MNGIYVGDGTESGFGDFELIAFVQDGEIRATSDSGVDYGGTVTVKEDGTYEGSLNLYDVDDTAFDTANIQGEFQTASSFNGDYTRPSGPTGNFSATYSARAYEEPASLDMIAGTWTVTNAVAANSITIETDGDIFGTDSDGCVYSGETTVPNPDRSLYSVDLLIESCGSLNGSYSGLMATEPGSSSETLILMIGNSSFGFTFDLLNAYSGPT